MGLIKRMRKQKAVWWQRLVADRFGRFGFAAPVEIECRWQDDAVEFRDARNESAVSKSVVFVDRGMSIGDRLQLGDLESSTPADPMQSRQSFEVRQFSQIPNLRATETLLTVYL